MIKDEYHIHLKLLQDSMKDTKLSNYRFRYYLNNNFEILFVTKTDEQH